MKQAIFTVLTNHLSVIASRRAEFLPLEKCSQVEAEEVLLHKSMAPRVRTAPPQTSPDRVWIYDDLEVMDELIRGAAMTGVQRVPPYAEDCSSSIHEGDFGIEGSMAHSDHLATLAL